MSTVLPQCLISPRVPCGPQEEGVRLRRQAAAGDRPVSSAAASLPPTAAPAEPMMYYVLALVALVVGVILGKLVL